MPLLPQRALVSALRSSRRPIAVLVGSPLSMDFSGSDRGVPGVEGVVDLVRQFVEEHDIALMPDLEEAIKTGKSADRYQNALSFLGGWVHQDAVNEVIRRAVMRACRNPSKFDGGDSVIDDTAPEDWWLTDGARQLGELLAKSNSTFTGPVLTTNFDPLVAVGVRAAGGVTTRTIMDSDGNVPKDAEENPGTHRVVHLHGYWRGSDTLHTPEQLVSTRDRLTASLRRILENRSLLVVGYAGWDDVFTRALADLLNDDQAQLDVLWCFREDEQGVVDAQYASLLGKVQGAISRGRFRSYGGVDCHQIFETIGSELHESSSSSPPPSCPLAGWRIIDPLFLDELPELDDQELLRYFNGQVPTWRHAASSRVPRRDAVSSLVELISTEADQGRLSIHVILGAGGEGKSTTLLQVAGEIASREGWRVIWRPDSSATLDPADFATLVEDDRDQLIVSDDGEELVRPMLALLRHVHESGGRGIHLLVASRDTDWLAAGGISQPWLNYAPGYSEPTRLRGVTSADAGKLVAAWSTLGDAGLGDLAKVPSEKERVEAITQAVKKEAGRQEGSFFGGMLEARLGEAGLREHLVPVLTRLSSVQLPGSALSLGDALMLVACCHGAGIPGLHMKVLADLLGVDEGRVFAQVLRPLGDEAAAVRSTSYAYVRHRKVADALLVVGEQRCGFDLPELWAGLVKSAIRCQPLPREWFPIVVHHGPKLFASLPQALLDSTRASTAISAAQALVDAQPQRLAYNLVDLARTHRAIGAPAKGAITLADSLERSSEQQNWADTARQYLYEWSVCEGTAGDPIRNVWIAALSLSDQMSLPITKKDAWLALSGLGAAFGMIQDGRDKTAASKARAACAALGFKLDPPSRTRGYFQVHEREARRAGVGQPISIEEALEDLHEGAQLARASIVDEGLPTLARETNLTFKRLADLIS